MLGYIVQQISSLFSYHHEEQHWPMREYYSFSEQLILTMVSCCSESQGRTLRTEEKLKHYKHLEWNNSPKNLGNYSFEIPDTMLWLLCLILYFWSIIIVTCVNNLQADVGTEVVVGCDKDDTQYDIRKVTWSKHRGGVESLLYE